MAAGKEPAGCPKLCRISQIVSYKQERTITVMGRAKILQLVTDELEELT